MFGLGTAWLGTALRRGALITAVHTVILTIYYWTLSPIGLPSHPAWLDFEHTWATGVPVHFGVIYLGYVSALWIWERRPPIRSTTIRADSIGRVAMMAVVISVSIVVASGVLEAIAIQKFPGVTWFVVRLLIAVPFTLLWWAAVGRDRAAAIGGGITLALIFATYGHFLGPVGLPSSSLRLLGTDPPPAPAEWLSYRQEFLVALPIMLVVAVGGYLLASRWTEGPRPLRLPTPRLVAVAVAVVAIVALGVIAAANTGPAADRATIDSAGSVSVERGAYYRGELRPASGQLHLVAEDRNPRVTPLPPRDRIELSATVTDPEGTVYDIVASTPMIEDPLGRFGTWWGIGFDVWHHGRSGIGTDLIPATRSNVAVFTLGELRADGQPVANGVPIHVMTMSHDIGRLELDVGDPDMPLVGVPDDHLRAVWSDYTGGHSRQGERARYALGAGVLLILLLMTIATIRTNQRREPA